MIIGSLDVTNGDIFNFGLGTNNGPNALTLPGQTLNTAFGTGGRTINGNSLQVQLGLLGAVGIMGWNRRQAI